MGLGKPQASDSPSQHQTIQGKTREWILNFKPGKYSLKKKKERKKKEKKVLSTKHHCKEICFS